MSVRLIGEIAAHHMVGTGGSQAHVTFVLPNAGSARILNAPGETSRSVGWHPMPVRKIVSHQVSGLIRRVYSTLEKNLHNGRPIRTSIYNHQVHAFALPHGPDLMPA